jgi:M6 family metalloprotease-like protein
VLTRILLRVAIYLWILLTFNGAPSLLFAAQTDQPVLVVLVEFNDVKHTYSSSSFGDKFFSQTSSSVLKYYKEASYGQFTISRAKDNFPTVNDNDGLIGWVRLAQDHPDCAHASDVDACNDTLITDALNAIAPYVDLSQYDLNNDGIISPAELSIIFIIAGYEDAYDNPTSQSVHGVQEEFPTPVEINGKKITHYALFGEKHLDVESNVAHQATIGIIAHEFGHLRFGFPDLYDTRNTGALEGDGVFDLMSNGTWGQSVSDLYAGETPVHLSAWSKNYAAFIIPTTISSTQTNLQLASVSNITSTFLKVPTANPLEYFLLENRQFVNFDAGFQSLLKTADTRGGIAIWHIDDSLLSCISHNTCNNDPNHKLVALEEADGHNDLNIVDGQSKVQDLFYNPNNYIFNDSSTPNSKLYNGTSSYVAAVNISTPANIMSLDIITAASSAPKIGYSPLSLSFTHEYSEATGPTQTISISNVGAGNCYVLPSAIGNNPVCPAYGQCVV